MTGNGSQQCGWRPADPLRLAFLPLFWWSSSILRNTTCLNFVLGVAAEVKFMQHNSCSTVIDLLAFNTFTMPPLYSCNFQTFSSLERNTISMKLSVHLFLPLSRWQALVCALYLWLYKFWTFYKNGLLPPVTLWACFLQPACFCLFI